VPKLSSGASGATPPPRAHGAEHAASHALAVARVAGQDDGFDDGAVLQLGDVMGFVDHVRGTLLGAAHFRLGVVRVLPLGVAGFAAFALFVEAAHGFGVLGVDACLGGKPLHIVPVAFLGVAMAERAQAGVDLAVVRARRGIGELIGAHREFALRFAFDSSLEPVAFDPRRGAILGFFNKPLGKC
jgi:hypothetical protein